MGIIDQTTYQLTCPQCSTEEKAKVLDKGSGWSGSHWQNSTNFKRFDTSWSGGGNVEPSLISATCKNCSVSAKWVRMYSV
ncbi:MAG: hypothetical protein Q7U57_00120 [Methylovulum sp.]|nr:hypothetical protein [Methylovulum sp.]